MTPPSPATWSAANASPEEQQQALREGAAKAGIPFIEPPRPLRIIGAADLCANSYRELLQVVQGLIVEGLTLLVGAPKIGKSWLVLDMCLSVAAGTPFLGRSTTRGNVLYLALEDSERRLQKRMRQIDLTPSNGLSFLTQAPTLEEGLLESLQGWITEAARLIVIDTFQKVRGASSNRANAYQQDYEIMSKIKRFADDNHIAIVLVHHMNKLKNIDDPYDKISGSTGLMGAADTTIMVHRERDSQDATVSFTGRDVWGDNFVITMKNGRWLPTGKDAETYAKQKAYKQSVIPKLCEALLSESFTGEFRITYEDFRNAALERFGELAACTSRELSTKIGALAPAMKEAGILVETQKSVGHGRGLFIKRVPQVASFASVDRPPL